MKSTTLLIAILALLVISCKKKTVDPHIPPDMSFKTGGIYTSGDRTITTADSITVGVIVKKTEDDLKSMNVSVYYDASMIGTTVTTDYLTSAQATYFEKDYVLHPRSTTGTEKFTFTILDRDGNTTQKSLTITVN